MAVSLAARAALSSPSTLIHAPEAQSDLVLTLIAALRDILKPIQKLESLLSYESMRDDKHPLLPPLKVISTELASTLAANGIVPVSATIGELFDEERHERSLRAGIVAGDDTFDDLVVREVVRPGYMHNATGAILVPAIVNATSANAGKAPPAASSGASSAPPPTATPRGTRMHEVSAKDTLQGLCVRYNVQAAALMRLNKLPNPQAIHSRRTLRLPPSQPSGAGTPSPSPMSFPMTVTNASTLGDDGPTLVVGGGSTLTGPMLVGHADAGGGEGTRSLAARISARRQARHSEGFRGGDGGGSTDAPRGEVAAADPRLMIELEAALRWSLSLESGAADVACTGGGLEHQFEHEWSAATRAAMSEKTSSVDEHGGGADSWLRAHVMHALCSSVADALLQPWRAVAERGVEHTGEMLFLRALAVHTSEPVLRALLEREGELLGVMAATLWRCLRALQAEGDARDGELLASAREASTSYGVYE